MTCLMAEMMVNTGFHVLWGNLDYMRGKTHLCLDQNQFRVQDDVIGSGPWCFALMLNCKLLANSPQK